MSVFLVQGDDESLLHSGVSELVHRLVGDNDRSLMVDEFDSADYELSTAAGEPHVRSNVCQMAGVGGSS